MLKSVYKGCVEKGSQVWLTHAVLQGAHGLLPGRRRPAAVKTQEEDVPPKQAAATAAALGGVVGGGQEVPGTPPRPCDQRPSG